MKKLKVIDDMWEEHGHESVIYKVRSIEELQPWWVAGETVDEFSSKELTFITELILEDLDIVKKSELVHSFLSGLFRDWIDEYFNKED